MNAVIKNLHESIAKLETEMLKLPQADCAVVHSFAPGLYVRQVMFKAGTYAIGHHQKTDHLNIMLSGRVTMVEPDGSLVERVAPLIYVGGPGRKCGYIHEDTVWLNVYATSETDVQKLEAEFLDKSESWNAAQPLLAYDRIIDMADFAAVIDELGVSVDLVHAQSEDTADQIPFPPGCYRVKTGQSRIHGIGLFATAQIRAGDVIAPARIAGKRTPAGRYTNHAKCPNALMRGCDNGDIDLVALVDIAGCRGGLDGEEITIDYRQSFTMTRDIGVAA